MVAPRGTPGSQDKMPILHPELRDARTSRIATIRRALIIGAATAGAVLSLAAATGGLPVLSAVSISSSSTHASQADARTADFAQESPSPDARHVADWIADSRDNANADFVIVDKRDTPSRRRRSARRSGR